MYYVKHAYSEIFHKQTANHVENKGTISANIGGVACMPDSQPMGC